MSDLKFANTYNLVAFLEKPTESEVFKEIVDFMNANPIKYALTVNLTIYCSCVKQFWDTVKAKMVNEEVQLQDLVDKKKVIITESTIRRDLQLEDANGVDCLPNAAIFEQLTLMGFVQVFVNKQVVDMSHHKRIYVTPSHTKKIFGNIKREGKGFSGRVTPLFQTMMVQAHKEMGEGSEIPTDPHHTPIITQPSSSQPQRKQKSRKSKKKNTEVPQPSGSTDNVPDENVHTTSNDPLLSGEDRVKLTELMNLCTNLQKKGRKLANIDADPEVTLINETQGRNDDNLMFDTGVLDEQEVEVEKVVSTAEVTTKSATTTTIDELTLAQTLIEIKAAKPKVREVMIQEPSEFTTTKTTPAASKPSQDKGKAKMIESEKPLKKKDQIMYDQEVALNLQAQLQAELEEEERLTR
ncbi:hypothetical protein Tco_0686692 [Tanacetum coccineum]